MYEYLDTYLRLNNINEKDIREFNAQVISHPGYPSLLAVSDTLHFLGVDNQAFALPKEEIGNLPENFLAVLKNPDDGKVHMRLVKSNSAHTSYQLPGNNQSKSVNKLDRISLQNLWTGTVFLIDGPDEKRQNNFKLGHFTSWGITLILMIAVLFFSGVDVFGFGIVFSALTGVYIAYQIIHKLYNDNSGNFSGFCSAGVNTSCDQILQSKKWRILDYVNFSDLALYLFAGELFLFSIASIYGQLAQFYSILLLGLCLFGIPIMGLSVYFQKYVERKWCPLCLIVSGIVISQIVMLLLHFLVGNVNLQYDFSSVFLLAGTLICTLLIGCWKSIKEILAERQRLKKDLIKSSRIAKDFDLFKLSLVNEGKLSFPQDCIKVESQAKEIVTISFVTNPFCSFCKEVHESLMLLYQQYGKRIKFEFVLLGFNQIEDRYPVFEKMAGAYLKDGGDYFVQVYSDFLNDDFREWIQKYDSIKINRADVEAFLAENEAWAYHNSVNFTPQIAINGYALPKIYDHSSIKYFVPALIEEGSLLDVEKEKMPALI